MTVHEGYLWTDLVDRGQSIKVDASEQPPAKRHGGDTRSASQHHSNTDEIDHDERTCSRGH